MLNDLLLQDSQSCASLLYYEMSMFAKLSSSASGMCC